MRVPTNWLQLYIKCPMAFLLRYRYGIQMPMLNQEELYDALATRFARAAVSYIMAGKDKKFILRKWGEAHAQVPEEFKKNDLYIMSSVYISRLYDTQERWLYIAAGMPYTYSLGDDYLDGTIDAIRIKEQAGSYKLQIVCFGRRPSTCGAEQANDIVGMVNRAAYANKIRKELHRVGEVETISYVLPDGLVFTLDDTEDARRKTLGYIRAIIRGMKNNVYYPRNNGCRDCGYNVVCDPSWCSSRNMITPRKTSVKLRHLLEKIDGGDGRKSRRGALEEQLES